MGLLPAWARQSPCAENPEIFFPNRPDQKTVAEAKAICREQCPHQLECLRYALEFAEPLVVGIWGGWNLTSRSTHYKAARWLFEMTGVEVELHGQAEHTNE